MNFVKTNCDNFDAIKTGSWKFGIIIGKTKFQVKLRHKTACTFTLK